MSKVTTESFVTLATNDSYCLGALTLAQSLRNANTNRSLTIMITNGVSAPVQTRLREMFDHVEVVNVLDSNDSLNLDLLKRPDLGITFTKFHCWRLTQFTKCVFLDADCLVLKNVDELFEREEFSAAADVGWPDCFNSGVFVYKPSLETYSKLQKFALECGSFDGGDQGLLNSYFSNWSTGESARRLPFGFNMTTNVSYTYAPAYKQFKDTIRIVHFIGANKPWKCMYDLDGHRVQDQGPYESEHLNQWWSVFANQLLSSLDDHTRTVHLRLRQSPTRIESASSNQSAGHSDSYAPTQMSHQHHHHHTPASDGVVIGSEQHQNLFQSGQVDYTGRDSFSNIQAFMDSKLPPKK
jgi:glycogenin glucosyltransferase